MDPTADRASLLAELDRLVGDNQYVRRLFAEEPTEALAEIVVAMQQAEADILKYGRRAAEWRMSTGAEVVDPITLEVPRRETEG